MDYEYQYSAIESFVDFCDDMIITEEGLLDKFKKKKKDTNKNNSAIKINSISEISKYPTNNEFISEKYGTIHIQGSIDKTNKENITEITKLCDLVNRSYSKILNMIYNIARSEHDNADELEKPDTSSHKNINIKKGNDGKFTVSVLPDQYQYYVDNVETGISRKNIKYFD